jgi:hypothetical protein
VCAHVITVSSKLSIESSPIHFALWIDAYASKARNCARPPRGRLILTRKLGEAMLFRLLERMRDSFPRPITPPHDSAEQELPSHPKAVIFAEHALRYLPPIIAYVPYQDLSSASSHTWLLFHLPGFLRSGICLSVVGDFPNPGDSPGHIDCPLHKSLRETI